MKRNFRLFWCCLLGISAPALAQRPAANTWKFAVSGDSRNCGDIVMPAIAEDVRRQGAAFYWHLGDYRAIYKFDEDYLRTHPQATITQYLADAWPDFIQHQLKPFGNLPVFLGIGNHDVIPPLTRPLFVAQFADWLDTPVIQHQRLADDPTDHRVKTYYHWIQGGVDFVTMDNASDDMFDTSQMTWLAMVLANDTKNSAVHSVVLAMHEALPDSVSAGHSMNESAQETASGRAAYEQLATFHKQTGKNVYIVASHAHFEMNDVYDTACHKNDVLPGWIMGSAGAVRYRLPASTGRSTVAKTDVYGYLLATVAPDGKISFEFRNVSESEVPAGVVKEFSSTQVNWCFQQNKSTYVPAGPKCSTAGPVEPY